MLLKKIIQEIKRKKELQYIDEGFVKFRILEYVKSNNLNLNEDFRKFSRTSQYKKLFKEIRRQCRLVYGSFQNIRDKRRREVYEHIFNEASGNSILDIGCGYAPLEYLSLYPKKTYYLCEIDTLVIKRIQECMKKNKIKGKVFVFNAVDDALNKLPKADVVLLLRVLESFEAIKRNISYRVIKELKCRKMVISFSKIALGGKEKIRKSGRQWLRRMLDSLGYKYTIGDMDKEIFFFVEKD